jgi:translation initiation factor 2B subunit (eIF-2B alpha/beta/delta family)
VDAKVRREIKSIAADAKSSATELLSRALQLLKSAAGGGGDVLAEVATELCRAQPAMAGLRTASALAVAAQDPAAAIDEFSARIDRAPSAIARYAVDLLALRATTGPLHVVTCSKSRPVEITLRKAAEQHELLVSCSEGRPAKEGRDLARALAESGITVDLYTDAGICAAVASADAVIVGADAIASFSFINKVGTSALCAVASANGTPCYVLAGREKILPDDVFAALTLRPGGPQEVWRDPVAGVQIRNPYFETIPLAWVSAIVTEAGVLQPAEVGGSGLWHNMSVSY